MTEPPEEIHSTSILSLATLDESCRWTGQCSHFKDGVAMSPPVHVAIGRREHHFYLFGCDSAWTPMWMSRHPNLAAAKNQAENEFEGISLRWRLGFHKPPRSVNAPALAYPPFEGEILWGGNPYGLSGYSKLSREILTRLSDSATIRLLSDPDYKLSGISTYTRDRLNALRRQEVSRHATLVRAYPPMVERAPGKRICLTMMETERVHPDYVRKINDSYHECWTPTKWNRQTFLDSGVRIPIAVVPLGVDPVIFSPGPPGTPPVAELLSTDRAGSREVPNGFLFVTLYQPTFRKGADVLLDAFEAAFSERNDVALILATTCYSTSTVENDVKNRRMKAPVYRLEGNFTDAQLADLFRACDAYVTASLGEGWNLPLCEAAACGLPVIAGRHSAHAELLTDDNAYFFDPEGYAPVKGAELVSPAFLGQNFAHFGKKSREHLAALLRQVAASPEESRRRGVQASSLMRTQYTWDRSAATALEHLRNGSQMAAPGTGAIGRSPGKEAKRQIEFGGGLGDVLNLCYFTEHYSSLSNGDRVEVFLTGHNPAAHELFKWHPSKDKLEIRDLGYIHPGQPGIEWKHLEGGLSRPEPYEFVYHDRVEFYPSPDDLSILAQLPQTPLMVFSISASSNERNFPVKLAEDLVNRTIAEGMTAVITGRHYALGDRSEVKMRPRRGLVDLTDRLSVPGTAKLLEAGKGLVACHSALCLLGWHLRKPVLLGYDPVTQRRVAEPSAMNHWFGIDRADTIHFGFTSFDESHWARFLEALTDNPSAKPVTRERILCEINRRGSRSLAQGIQRGQNSDSPAVGAHSSALEFDTYGALASLAGPRSILGIGIGSGQWLVALYRGSRGIQEIWGVEPELPPPEFGSAALENLRAAGARCGVHLSPEGWARYCDQPSSKRFDLVHVDGKASGQLLASLIRESWTRLNAGGVMVVTGIFSPSLLGALEGVAAGLQGLGENFSIPTAGGLWIGNKERLRGPLDGLPGI